MHVGPVRGERGGWGLGRGVVRADVVLEALVAARWDGEWQGTRSTAANVGQRVGGFIAGEAHVAGDPAEEDGPVVSRIGVFDHEDLGDQFLELDRKGRTIK